MTSATLPAVETTESSPFDEWALSVPAMGGSLGMRVASSAPDTAEARRDLDRVARRVDCWAARLTRYTTTSDLAALNRDPGRGSTPVRPTLAAVLDWAERALDTAPGLLDVTLLDARLAAESGLDLTHSEPVDDAARPRWHLVRHARGGEVVRRGRFRFDIDGVAKGWIADRALALLERYPAAMVDADGDIALRIDADIAWDIAVADPRPDAPEPLAVVRLDDRIAGTMLGIATSGTSVHRWPAGDGGSARHHLIDPRTRRPAVTDVVQATVIAGSARAAEVLAKAAVIAGSDDALSLLDRSDVHGVILLLDSGETIATPGTLGWLA